jgi:hypothetical protein
MLAGRRSLVQEELMKLIRSKLTFANVIACLALFVALGGVSYAALQLPKNSVGAKQLKKKAVTPAKLSPAVKRQLARLGTPDGIGTVGPQGKQGPVGPQGPGAVTINAPAGASSGTVASFDGVNVVAACAPTSVLLGLSVDTGTIQVSGTANNPNSEEVERVDITGGESSFSQSGVTSPYNVDLNVIARSVATSATFGRFDIHLDPSTCVVWGMYTPSTAPAGS